MTVRATYIPTVRVPKSGELTCKQASTPSGSVHRMNTPGPDGEPEEVAEGVVVDDVADGCEVLDEDKRISVEDAAGHAVRMISVGAIRMISLDTERMISAKLADCDADRMISVEVFEGETVTVSFDPSCDANGTALPTVKYEAAIPIAARFLQNILSDSFRDTGRMRSMKTSSRNLTIR
jgi:hypothetical protein